MVWKQGRFYTYLEQEQAVIEMNGDDISVESDSETDEAVRFMSTLNYDGK